nr:DUF4143 domain-containing protein [Corynebacterium sp. HMSC074A01]
MWTRNRWQDAGTAHESSKARLRVSPKYHLADPGLAVAALGATTASLTADPETTGFLFESAVIHDLAVMVEAMGGKSTITGILMVTRSTPCSRFPMADGWP